MTAIETLREIEDSMNRFAQNTINTIEGLQKDTITRFDAPVRTITVDGQEVYCIG